MMLSRLWIQLIIFFKGIRFYETETLPNESHISFASFRTKSGLLVEFYFYKEECVDLVYQRGQIREERFIGYTVHSKFDDGLRDTHVFKYNNLKFFFHCPRLLKVDDREICRTLLSIFLDRIEQ